MIKEWLVGPSFVGELVQSNPDEINLIAICLQTMCD